jgi:hypothetical protein
VKIEAGAEQCVNLLLDLIATRVSIVVPEAVAVMKGIPLYQYISAVANLEFTIFSADTHRHVKG